MRVISQDGRTDIPYDNFVFGITKDNFIVAIRDTVARPSEVCQGIVAEYSTKAKAQNAMEMLRDTYQYGKRVAVPKFDESGIDKEDDITLYNTRLINDFFKGGTYVPTKVFQFPKDEDVEA